MEGYRGRSEVQALARPRLAGTKRLVDRVADATLSSGVFYASAANTITGPAVDQADTFPDLANPSCQDQVAVVRLHELLLRIRRSEAWRRSAHPRMAGPELGDVTHQAAADALVAVTAKIGQFRGESRFTTWAYKFVIFEVSTKTGRHVWRRPTVAMDTGVLDRLPDRFDFDPARASEWQDLKAALHRAVDEVLTVRQRQIFVGIVLNGVPPDALVAELGTNRNAIHKMLFAARRKFRAELVANGFWTLRPGGPRERLDRP